MSILSPASNAVRVPNVTVELAVPAITKVLYRSSVVTDTVVAVELTSDISLDKNSFTSAAVKTSPAVKVFLGILDSFVLSLVYQ
jgi:hypothetical protein